MILGLILSTLNQLPSPPELVAEPPAIFTPLALKNFPSSQYTSVRGAIFGHQSEIDGSAPCVPSLVELLLHHARIMPVSNPYNPHKPGGRRLYQRYLELENKFEMTTLHNLFQQNKPFYIHPLDVYGQAWSYRRNLRTAGPQIMYISSATLVVVPPNILGQWDREINKHCERALRVLILRSGTQLPSAKALAADYDVRFLFPSLHYEPRNVTYC